MIDDTTKIDDILFFEKRELISNINSDKNRKTMKEIV